MSSPSLRAMCWLAVCCSLLFLLAACGPFGPADSSTPATARTDGAPARPTTGGTPTPTPTTAQMPVTQTACPPAGTARAAVFAPLALGPHQNIVYVFNQGTSSNNWSGELKRYDTSTGQKVIIVNAPTSQIFGAQISADGKWILFTTQVSGQDALQLVRMDGQGLQTLYCSANGTGYIQWSPDQKTVVFMDGLRLVMEGLGSPSVYSLDLATGHLQVELVEPTAAGSFGAAPAGWLDDTHLYMTSFFIGGVDFPLPQSLSVLDTAKGARQQLGDLIKVFSSSGSCLSFDSSVEHTKLFVSTCHLQFGDGPTPRTQQGPSAIISQPAMGGPQTAVYSTPTLAITTLCVISSTKLLLLIQNLSGDTSRNGLWKMNLDGTGLARLTTAGTGQMSWLNGSRFPWSNVSRDGSLYALENSSNNGTTQSLLIGSLSGASPSTFATVSSTIEDNVAIVGWTTM